MTKNGSFLSIFLKCILAHLFFFLHNGNLNVSSFKVQCWTVLRMTYSTSSRHIKVDQHVTFFPCKPGQGFWRWIKRRIDTLRCPATVTIAPAQRTTGDVQKTSTNTRRAQVAKSKWDATDCLFDRHVHILKYPCSFMYVSIVTLFDQLFFNGPVYSGSRTTIRFQFWFESRKARVYWLFCCL